ncbi:MAG: flagellar biosynthesis protein FlgF, partial [Gammaproteobacteria bacterium]|nr:flagellar biosynthesis protein FlgF [Gammaproteobacteria bacterium]
ALQVVDRIKLVNPPEEDMVKGADSLMHMASFQPAIADATVSLQGGALESSNVNAIEAMVNMIQLARHYEMQVKVMASAEENDKASSSLMRMG